MATAGRKPKVSTAQLEIALQQASGNLSQVARDLGVSRSTVNRHVVANKKLQKICEDAREELVDIAENMLKQKINQGDVTAVIFTLKTQGKRRGYIERQEITNTEPVEILVTYENKPKG